MGASPRNLLLLSLGVVVWAAVASLIATTIAGPVSKNPTCGQLRDDASLQRRTVVALSKEFDAPPGITRAELSRTVRRSLGTECERLRRKGVREGGRRPLGADLRGTVTRRLRELGIRRRAGGSSPTGSRGQDQRSQEGGVAR